jgi:hypothetical protein
MINPALAIRLSIQVSSGVERFIHGVIRYKVTGRGQDVALQVLMGLTIDIREGGQYACPVNQPS